MDSNELRLDRIEKKLDRLSQMLETLARLDERSDAIEQKLQRHELRLDLIEKDTNENSIQLSRMSGRGLLIERGAWIVFAAAVGVLSQFIK